MDCFVKDVYDTLHVNKIKLLSIICINSMTLFPI